MPTLRVDAAHRPTGRRPAPGGEGEEAAAAEKPTLEVTSPELESGTIGQAQAFNGFGCTGENIAPSLSWSAGPEGTKSYAITAYDPDAPTGSGWWHWLAFNIPADVTSLEAGGAMPGGRRAIAVSSALSLPLPSASNTAKAARSSSRCGCSIISPRRAAKQRTSAARAQQQLLECVHGTSH